MLPHLAQRKDPSYRMAEGVVLKADLTDPPTQYLSNHLLGPTQILNLSLDDQTTLYIVQIL